MSNWIVIYKSNNPNNANIQQGINKRNKIHHMDHIGERNHNNDMYF